MNRVDGRRARGFTLIEMVIVLAIIGVLVTFGYPALQELLVRSRIESATRNTANIMRLARLEAIKHSVQVLVNFNSTAKTVWAYANVDGTAGFSPDASKPAGTVDYQVGSTYQLPEGVSFGAPAGQTAITFSGNAASFESDGSVDSTGQVDFVDQRGNYLQVKVEPQATAKVAVLKWDETRSVWHPSNEENHPWKWN
ncbi:MAG TPA: GspH/FimT family pseudopilin [Thermoanaerobaculia bacterium]|nr:GspH/FimT family pseudopilin [Thermoanaerobaculia bacterium]